MSHCTIHDSGLQRGWCVARRSLAGDDTMQSGMMDRKSEHDAI